MSPFSPDENAPPAVESPATTCTTTTEEDESIGEIKVLLEEDLDDEIELELEWVYLEEEELVVVEEEELVDEIQLVESKELEDLVLVNQKKTKKPLIRGIVKRRESKPTAAAATNINEFPERSSPTRRKLSKSKQITFLEGLDNKTPKKSIVNSPATTCTPTKEQVELIGEIRVLEEEDLVDEIELECKEIVQIVQLVQEEVIEEKRTNEPFGGFLKKKKLVLRKGLKK